jgi:biopolymer transport protein ExbD
MARNHRRMQMTVSPGLNLVSLIDIFTLLVFFLMINAGDVQVLQSNAHIKLPDSVAEKMPKETLVIMVSGGEIIVQGRKVADVATVLSSESNLIVPLSAELNYHSGRRPELTELEKQRGRSVTIMGDKAIPYTLLKRVMMTCSQADYADIVLAVNRVYGAKQAPSNGEG